MQLGQVCAAVPLDFKLRQLIELFVIAPRRIDAKQAPGLVIAPPELIDVKVGFLRCHKQIERLRVKVLSLLRVVLRLHGIVHDVRRSDGDPIARIGLLMLDRIEEIDASVLVCLRPADEDKVCLIADQAVQYLDAVVKALRTESGRVVSGCRDADHQLVCIGLRCLFEDVVLLCPLVSVHLVGDDDVAVERILSVRVACQGIEADGAAGKALVADGVLHVVVKDSPPGLLRRLSVFVHRYLDVVLPVFKRLHRLLECRADDVYLRSALPLKQRERVRQRADKHRLAVFARDKNKRLLDDALICPPVKKHQHAVHAEALPWLKHQRFPPQRLSVKRLSLPVLKRRLDDPDHKVRILCAHLVFRVFRHLRKPSARLHALPVGNDLSVDHVLDIASYVRRVFTAIKSHELSASFSSAARNGSF